jgi:tyrosyl-tRNA synthetase
MDMNEEAEKALTRGVVQILPNKEGLAKLMERKIKLYQGFDPTSNSLHLGHLVAFRKLAQFQKAGHEVIFLIGDGTGQAGDPSDKIKAREKFFTQEELIHNSENYKTQAAKFLNFEGENAAKLLFNSEWLNKLNLVDILEIAQHFSVQQLIERDMYQERMKKGEAINLREFIYPLLQGYDSVVMEVDLEVGGNDQLFNMLSGRTLLRAMKNKEKYVLTTKLLTDPSGKKMGKSEGNAVELTNSPKEIYGKIMSFPDSMTEIGIELLTDISLDEIKEPMQAKKQLAFEVVKQLSSQEEAQSAQEYFEQNFQDNKPEYNNEVLLKENLASTISDIAGSMSEAKRLIRQGAVDVNDEVITNPKEILKKGDKIKVGKTWFGKTV